MIRRRVSSAHVTACNERHITPVTLAGAPELAVLVLLDETLRVAALALLAAQPALIGEPPSWRVTPELITARRLLRDVARLEAAVADYRRVVLEMLHDAPNDDDDLPF